MKISDRHRLLATILLTSSLWSCASTPGASKATSGPKPQAGERRTYVFNSAAAACLVPQARIVGDSSPESGVLVGAIASKLIGLAVDSAASALQRAAAAKTETISATNGSFFHLYGREQAAAKGTVTVLGKCVTVVMLDSARDWVQFTAAAGAEGVDVSPATIAGVRKALQMDDKGRKGGPVFYYEATVVASEDNTAFQLRPAFLYYPESLGTGKVGDERALNLVYTYRNLSGTAVATSTLSLPAIRVGSVRGAPENRYFQAPWLPTISLSEAAKATVSQQDSIEKPEFDLANDMTPFNLEVSVSETRNAREWLKGIADALGSAEVKTAATTALKQTLIPAEGQTAEDAAAVSAMSTEADRVLSVRDVEIACVERAATVEGSVQRAKADRDVIEKQYKANEKAIKAGAKRPYAKPDTPSCTP